MGNIPFHNITPLQSMMIAIQDDGQKGVWDIIEKVNNPFKRCECRKLFSEAIKKIKEESL